MIYDEMPTVESRSSPSKE